jgi:hypothetical protein
MLSDQELERLKSLADRNELKQSDYVRQLLKREWEREEERYNQGAGKQLRSRGPYPRAILSDRKPRRK